jgi:hypothetical protein
MFNIRKRTQKLQSLFTQWNSRLNRFFVFKKLLKLRNIAGSRMASSGMLRPVALLRTDFSGELSASIIKVTKIGELGIRLAVTINRRTPLLVTVNLVSSSPILVTLMMEAVNFSETSVLIRTTWRNKKTPFFIVTTVNISNLTSLVAICTSLRRIRCNTLSQQPVKIKGERISANISFHLQSN